jgi:hypothetical protein
MWNRRPAAGLVHHSDSEYVGAGAPGLPDPQRWTRQDPRCRDAPEPHPHSDRRAVEAVSPRICRWPGSPRRGARLVDGATSGEPGQRRPITVLSAAFGEPASTRPSCRRRSTCPASHRPARPSSVASTPTRTFTLPLCAIPRDRAGHRGVLHHPGRLSRPDLLAACVRRRAPGRDRRHRQLRRWRHPPPARGWDRGRRGRPARPL